jgi:hypothetical protein
MSIVNLDFGIKIVRSHVASEMRVRVPKEHIWYQNAKILQERFPVHFDAILTEVIRGDCKHYKDKCRWMLAEADDANDYFQIQVIAKPPRDANAKAKMVAKATYLARRIAMDAQALHV